MSDLVLVLYVICNVPLEETDAAAIAALSLEEVLKTYDAFLAPSSTSTTRKKLSLQLVSQQVADTPPPTNATLVYESTQSEFKASLGCYPAVLPISAQTAPTRSML